MGNRDARRELDATVAKWRLYRCLQQTGLTLRALETVTGVDHVTLHRVLKMRVVEGEIVGYCPTAETSRKIIANLPIQYEFEGL